MVELLPKKFMILLEISTGEYYNLSQIAEKIGITKQGVHEYMKKMREEGLIEIIEGKYRVTVKGVEAIFSYLDKLDRYLEEKKKKLNIMEYSVAIAGDDIKKGEKVYLAMENGYLHAYKSKKTSASATAAENAGKGEDIAIKNIRGIIEYPFGKIHLISLPNIKDGGSKRLEIKKLKKAIEEIKADRIGVSDVVAKVAIEKAGIKYDFEFCPIQTALEAVQKGLTVILLGEEKEIRYAISKIEEYNANALKEIEYELHDFSS
ncbi:MAG TPA: winged helix-turn-helix transcriptional regulator [Thermoplasmatales archaeon]|nr:winged helix-turn-helix transcriptional regulator [Thermoplasmatales archaeon]